MGWFGWQTVSVENFEELQRLNIVQSDTAVFGLWFTYSLVPVIGVALATVVWFFYRLKDSQVQIMSDCNSGKISREQADEMLESLKKKSFKRRGI